jgi:hypothetical protein
MAVAIDTYKAHRADVLSKGLMCIVCSDEDVPVIDLRGANDSEGDNGSMSGEGGNGSMSGEGGNGSMSGEGGNGSMSGEGGNGSMSGEGGNGSMSGEGGNGSMSCEGGNGSMSGEGGNVSMSGDSGNGSMSGEGGDGSMSGDSGNRSMSGDCDGNQNDDEAAGRERRRMKRLRSDYEGTIGKEEEIILMSDRWVNDAIVCRCLSRLCARKDGEFFAVPTLYYQKDDSEGRRFMDYMLSKHFEDWPQTILLPFHRAYHWSLFVISPKLGEIEYWDSRSCDDTILYEYAEQLKERLKGITDISWVVRRRMNLPQQIDEVNCGIMLLLFAESIVDNLNVAEISTSEKDLRDVRVNVWNAVNDAGEGFCRLRL